MGPSNNHVSSAPGKPSERGILRLVRLAGGQVAILCGIYAVECGQCHRGALALQGGYVQVARNPSLATFFARRARTSFPTSRFECRPPTCSWKTALLCQLRPILMESSLQLIVRRVENLCELLGLRRPALVRVPAPQQLAMPVADLGVRDRGRWSAILACLDGREVQAVVAATMVSTSITANW